jgi:CBS domain containing-hemolysin-like protein
VNGDEIISISLKIIAVMVLVALNGFFVAAEFALVRVRETQLEALAAKGKRAAKRAQSITKNLNAYLSAAQLGITLASLGLGWIGEPVFMALLEPVFHWMNLASAQVQHVLALVIGMSVITFLHICVGEQAPKLLAIQKPVPTSLWVAAPLIWFYWISYPLVMVLNSCSNWLLRRVGLNVEESHESYSEDELRGLMASAQNSTDRRNLILNTLDLRNRIAREVMRPRNEISLFAADATITECLEIAERTRYSRFPICENGDPDKARSVVHIKDLYAMRDKARTALDLLPVARPLICVPETAPLEKLLKRFLEKKTHFAFVVDEFGGTVGIVTLENVIEAVVGQIQDEFDAEATQFIRKSENIWEVSGILPLHELEKIVGTVVHDESVATASGWMTEKLGGFPKTGDMFALGNFEFRVEEMDGPRVAKLKITQRK